MTRNELQRVLLEAQRKSRETLSELAEEGRRIGVTAGHEMKDLLGEARASGRERLIELGGELEKLGRRLSKMARGTHRKAPARKVARREPPHAAL